MRPAASRQLPDGFTSIRVPRPIGSRRRGGITAGPLYVSRRDYFKIYLALMLVLGIPMAFLGLYYDWTFWKVAALGGGTVSLFYLGYSLLGLYRMYGHPGRAYVSQLLRESGAGSPAVVADLHIGTYRHAYVLADVLPNATIHSIDCWGFEGEPHETGHSRRPRSRSPPTHHPRILPAKADQYTSAARRCELRCRRVRLRHARDPERRLDGQTLRGSEARAQARRPCLMFEHGNDFHNVIIFGPIIGHVVPRYEWAERFRTTFADAGYPRTSQAVDLFWGTKAEPTGQTATPLPKPASRRTVWILVVILTFTLISLGVVAFLPASQLVPIYWAIAVSGLTWPWIMIGVALAGDRLTRKRVATDVSSTPFVREQSVA